MLSALSSLCGVMSHPQSELVGLPVILIHCTLLTLRPLLFLILIGDMTWAFLFCFADDTRIGCQITSINDSDALQAYLDTVYNWTEQNNMELNSDKSEYSLYMRYGSNKTLQALTHYMTNTGSMIQEKDSVKDLGVTMTNDGTVKKHIQHAVCEAKRQYGWILRTLKFWSYTSTPLAQSMEVTCTVQAGSL